MEIWAETGAVRGAGAALQALGVLVLTITAAPAESFMPLHICLCDCGTQQWPWGDKPPPGAAHSTWLAIPSHQEAGISECLHLQTRHTLFLGLAMAISSSSKGSSQPGCQRGQGGGSPHGGAMLEPLEVFGMQI